MADQNTRSKELRSFVTGTGVTRDVIRTHHDDSFLYYSIPTDRLKYVWFLTERSWVSDTPFTLSEHSYPHNTRLFLDLDLKQDSTITCSDMIDFMLLLQPCISKLPIPDIKILVDQVSTLISPKF